MKLAIVGPNASGKTVKLRQLMENGVFSSKYVSNFDIEQNPFIDMFKISEEKFEIVEDIIVCDEIYVANRNLTVITNDEHLQYSPEFLQIVWLLCLDVDRIYLDEPEFSCINKEEEGKLRDIMARVIKYYKDFVITTHSTLFLGIGDSKVMTIEQGKLVAVKEGANYEYLIEI